jgi:uncharacterized protein YggU (UPF0235/DUF167 family)
MNIIRVRAKPGQKNQSVSEISEKTLRISVREPAENNQANRKILELVAEFYEIPHNKLRMISGHAKPGKIIQILD